MLSNSMSNYGGLTESAKEGMLGFWTPYVGDKSLIYNVTNRRCEFFTNFMKEFQRANDNDRN